MGSASGRSAREDEAIKNDLTLPTEALATADREILPALIGEAGERAQYKFVEFFTAHLSSENTRRTYARAVYRFLAGCEGRGLELAHIHPVAVAGYIRGLEGELAPASVKVHLAAIRMLFDWFVVEGVMSYNPASSVKGPKHSPKRGKTPVLTPRTRGGCSALLNSSPSRTTGTGPSWGCSSTPGCG